MVSYKKKRIYAGIFRLTLIRGYLNCRAKWKNDRFSGYDINVFILFEDYIRFVS